MARKLGFPRSCQGTFAGTQPHGNRRSPSGTGGNLLEKNEAGIRRVAFRASHTTAPDVTAAAAPFRAWRGSQLVVARGPTRFAIEAFSGLTAVILGLVLDREDRAAVKRKHDKSLMYGCQAGVNERSGSSRPDSQRGEPSVGGLS